MSNKNLNSGIFTEIPNLAKRNRKEAVFRIAGLLSIAFAAFFLVLLLSSLIFRAIPAFSKSEVELNINFDAAFIDIQNDSKLLKPDFGHLIRTSLFELFPEVQETSDKRNLYRLIGKGSDEKLRRMILKNPDLIGQNKKIWITLSSDASMYLRGYSKSEQGKLKPQQIKWLDSLSEQGRTRNVFNDAFFTSGDSRNPEEAGILGAMIGSLLIVITSVIIALPIGVMTAIYLEEFARPSKITEIIEININNLAAVPSIIFGLLGLALYINFLSMPRSSAMVGGLTLSLMILPTIIIATRSALRSIPRAIREAALAIGASPMQVVLHHTLPLAMPGIMTGTILGISRVIGETAPLIMIGMVAFVADIPTSFLDPSSAMPVQIYLWSDSPEAAFANKTAACIIILLIFLVTLNSLAIYMRKKFEKRW